jgi:thiamine biosynthesis lipoprotein
MLPDDTPSDDTRVAVPLALDAKAFVGLDRFAVVTDLAGETMGTMWRVRLAAPTGFDTAALQVGIEARLAAIVAEMSHWLPTSLLCGFNRSPANCWTELPDDFAAVIGVGLEIARRSNGAFDPTIGRLVDLRGFGPTARTGVPATEDLDVALQASGWRKLAFAAQTLRIRQPGGMWLDLSGIAKGYAVDVVADLIGEAGIKHCLVEIGGELVGRGLRPDGDPWWVDLETPPDVSFPPMRVALHQMAVATSGDYVRGAHNLDPATGLSVQNGVSSVSVLHKSAMIADGWASALTVMGPENAAMTADREGLPVRLIVREGADVMEWISPALEAML